MKRLERNIVREVEKISLKPGYNIVGKRFGIYLIKAHKKNIIPDVINMRTKTVIKNNNLLEKIKRKIDQKDS